ncbi:opioid growth factor receptor-like protein 1 isoform X2 [Hyperolius riggenbachi]|uniref:opioid growth factor receptor-like protein 1 isoform X2 n=1 Tax=Hyperolius riggenbachi TaxID=752182 RepID=UPI0035A39411
MGNLLNGGSFKEPTTVEDCDSTWETDSGGEEEGEEEEAETDGLPEEGRQPGSEEQGSEVTAGETADTGHQSGTSAAEQNIKPPKRSFYAARDLYKYRHQYPNLKDLRCQNDLSNLRFYMNKIPFKPDGVFIEEILNKWKSDYEKLEHNHTYIQWLFPLREQGLNFYAKELTSYEIEEFKKTKEAVKRFILAYKMMLDFFGLKLVDKNGNISRAANWPDRFQHLNESQHNYLRITRILKSLGELGYEHFKPPLVRVLLQESIVENTIPNMKLSALEYFVYSIKERKERRRLLRYACNHYNPPEHFIWGPPIKQKAQQSKCIKKTIHSNRSVNNCSQKSKDVKTEYEGETPTITLPGERLIETALEEEHKQEVTAVDELEKLVEDIENKMETRNDDSELKQSDPNNLHTHLNETTNPSLSENYLLEQNTENFIKDNNIVNIVIVDSTDEGVKDCLCSLSPAATADTTASTECSARHKEDKAT